MVDALLATARSVWQPEDAGDFVLGDPTLRSAMETSSLFAFLDGALFPCSLFAFLDGALFPTCPLRRGLREGLRQVGVGVGWLSSPSADVIPAPRPLGGARNGLRLAD